MVICSKVSKNGKRFVCICNDNGKIVSFDRLQISSIIELYCYFHNENVSITTSLIYEGLLTININLIKGGEC